MENANENGAWTGRLNRADPPPDGFALRRNAEPWNPGKRGQQPFLFKFQILRVFVKNTEYTPGYPKVSFDLV